MYSLTRAFCQQTATSMLNGRKKTWNLVLVAFSSRIEGSVEFIPMRSLACFYSVRIKQGENREIWYLSHFKAMKAQSSSCQCTDSPEPLLLAQMWPKSPSTRLIDDINGIIMLVVSQVPSLAMCGYHTIGHFFKNSVSCSMKSLRCPRGIKVFKLIMFLFLFFGISEICQSELFAYHFAC